MKRLILILINCYLIIVSSQAQSQWESKEWPVLKHYDQEHLYNIALPLGGIGTGTFSIGGRGELRDWEIMNIPGKGFSTVTKGNDAPFFAIYYKPANSKPVTKGLMGPLDPVEYLHYEGRPVNHHGIPRFENASFDAAYPFGQVNLSGNDDPLTVKIKAFNPLVPGDEDASGHPIGVLSYEVTNTGNKELSVSIVGSMRNFVGKDGSKFRTDWKGDNIPIGAKNNQNVYKEAEGIKGIYMYSDDVSADDPAWGNMAFSTDARDGVTYRTSSKSNAWSNSLLDFWDDFSEDGELTEKDQFFGDDPMASLAVKRTIAPGETKVFNYFITWHFPNRKGWSNEVIGNYYTSQNANAWEAALKIVPQLSELETNTLTFVNALINSDYPKDVKEAALFNINVLRSQTVFRIPSGHMMGWEGVMDRFGSCAGSCTHVWNYEQTTPFLFGNLARTMRDVELNYASQENGFMCFRAGLPLSNGNVCSGAAADGQMGAVMKFYREWQLSGDNTFLENNYAKVKKTLSYAWEEGSWDANQDGVMEGSQHNTMDVNYFGPNPQMGIWYLGALKAASEMAAYMKDKAFEKKCLTLYQNGSLWIDEHLFNGEYYEQKVTNPDNFEEFLDWENNPDIKIPDFQLGKGCLVDQLVGQYMAHICGLGYLVKEENVKTTLNSIMKYNYRSSFEDHFNNMRSYVLGDEAGLLMAAWPKGRLKVPFPYFSEAMTGFEYTAAVGMIYEGQDDKGLQVISDIRNRFDGRKRNPFSEPECGHHYARSMASWASILAISDFQYSGVDKSMQFTSNPGKYFWSNGYAWGTAKVENKQIELEVLFGNLELKKASLNNGLNKKVKLNLSAGDRETIQF
ncbi:GH116 family glycosyl-hydrolase [Echinicola shivajiensis]|uniref:GH116 family glycosyl-hydrolase n=1 Tax=Echinicola shivajiensis TaxID=1035916 RepID=UPI001BFC0139|nr:GH116 family glycosyl-hydrolase [Echinicola shivajiensis]